MKSPVLVVGAGPVGLTLACELARFGIAVRIVDKAAQRTDKSKALVVWSRTLELLDRGGGSAPFIDAGYKAHAVNFVAGDGKLMGRVTMDAIPSPYPFGLMLPQSDTERLLEERLEAFGVRVERQVELTALATGVDDPRVQLRHADGGEESLAPEWLIGCDGAHSFVRHAIGSSFEGETMNSDWMLADVHMRGYPFPDSEASIYWHQDGAFVIFPISPGRYRVLADLPATAAEHPPTPTLAQVQAVIDHRGPGHLEAFDPIWLAGFRINGRKVANYRAGRIFLAGDAAHIHSPAGGQGMNTGMQDAFNLAWKLALVIRKTCGERLLDSYDPERSAVGDEVLKTAGRLTAVATLKNPIAQSVRNVIGHIAFGLPPVRHALANTMGEVSIGYPDSPLNGPGLGGTDAPKPGQRLAPIDGQIPPGSGDTPLFALFAERDATTLALVRRFHGLVEADVRPPLHAGALWLVRPDGYVACSAIDAEVIGSYLDGLVQA